MRERHEPSNDAFLVDMPQRRASIGKMFCSHVEKSRINHTMATRYLVWLQADHSVILLSFERQRHSQAVDDQA